MGAALALAERGRGRTGANPSVGCVILRDGRVVGRGWTQPGGRPHAEAMALEQAGAAAAGAVAYVTLEPCAHQSERGPACADLLVAAGVAGVVVAHPDPDPRTDGLGIARLRAAGIHVEEGIRKADAAGTLAGFLTRLRHRRPQVTLKLAMSLDGAIAMGDGHSQWITGAEARAHVHLERSRHEHILVGRGTMEADLPRLDVRLPGLAERSPEPVVLTSGPPPLPGVRTLARPEDVGELPGNHLLVEGGAGAAAAFLQADLIDRLLLYRAPILIGGGLTLPDNGLQELADAHGRWRHVDSRKLGVDRLDVYERG